MSSPQRDDFEPLPIGGFVSVVLALQLQAFVDQIFVLKAGWGWFAPALWPVLTEPQSVLYSRGWAVYICGLVALGIYYLALHASVFVLGIRRHRLTPPLLAGGYVLGMLGGWCLVLVSKHIHSFDEVAGEQLRSGAWWIWPLFVAGYILSSPRVRLTFNWRVYDKLEKDRGRHLTGIHACLTRLVATPLMLLIVVTTLLRPILHLAEGRIHRQLARQGYATSLDELQQRYYATSPQEASDFLNLAGQLYVTGIEDAIDRLSANEACLRQLRYALAEEPFLQLNLNQGTSQAISDRYPLWELASLLLDDLTLATELGGDRMGAIEDNVQLIRFLVPVPTVEAVVLRHGLLNNLGHVIHASHQKHPFAPEELTRLLAAFVELGQVESPDALLVHDHLTALAEMPRHASDPCGLFALNDWRHYCRLATRTKLVRLPSHEAWPQLSAMSATHQSPFRFLFFISALFDDGLAVEAAYRHQARANCWRGWLVLEMHRLEHHAYPVDLGALSDQHGDQWPKDPFSGHPIQFRIESDAVRVFSNGSGSGIHLTQ